MLTKERLRLLFDCQSVEQAQKELVAWIQEAQTSRITILIAAARKLMMWRPFILNWYKHRISTGKLEVMNRKIGMLQRQACGYRDDEYLKLRILHLHKSTYSLTGWPPFKFILCHSTVFSKPSRNEVLAFQSSSLFALEGSRYILYISPVRAGL